MTLYTLPAVRRKGLHLMLHQPDVPHLLNIVSIWRQRSVFLETEQQTKQVVENRALLIDLRFRDIKSPQSRSSRDQQVFFLERARLSQQMLSIEYVSVQNSWRPQKAVWEGNSSSFKAENGIIQTASVWKRNGFIKSAKVASPALSFHFWWSRLLVEMVRNGIVPIK